MYETLVRADPYMCLFSLVGLLVILITGLTTLAVVVLPVALTATVVGLKEM